MRKVLGVYSAPHWGRRRLPRPLAVLACEPRWACRPVLAARHAGPADFAPADKPRGVGTHPHRGFETVTIVYKGEVEHRASTGKGGIIGPGDVQWMTAAGGILHKDFHSQAFTRKGGTLEMVQLWVNLPAKDKDAEPGYQTLLDRDISAVELPGDAGTLRVIAGEFDGQHRAEADAGTAAAVE